MKCVDRAHAGRAGVADPARLERGRLVRHHHQAIFSRVTGEVDQDIDPVGADQAGHDVVRSADLTDIVPADELTAHPLGDFVRAWCIRVGIQGQAGVAGEVLQHGFEEARHRVTAEVARNGILRSGRSDSFLLAQAAANSA